MSRFLLVHGSSHGAWCWRDVLPSLRAAGHEAQALDLPSHGDDPTPPGTVTMDDYADTIVAALGDVPPIVVGHSMGGFPITAAAERAPGRIARLVYLCAYVPRSGASLSEMRREAPRQPLIGAIVRAKGARSFSFDPAQVEARFYHDCPPGTLDYALPRLTPQPTAPQETPLPLTEISASVAKTYIRCTDDRAIPPEHQAEMARGLPLIELPCGHSPFFAMPERLAALLDRIARE